MWDVAATTNEEFTSVAIQAELLQTKCKDVVCINIITEHNAKLDQVYKDDDYLHIPCFEELKSKDVKALSMKIIDFIWREFTFDFPTLNSVQISRP